MQLYTSQTLGQLPPVQSSSLLCGHWVTTTTLQNLCTLYFKHNHFGFFEHTWHPVFQTLSSIIIMPWRDLILLSDHISIWILAGKLLKGSQEHIWIASNYCGLPPLFAILLINDDVEVLWRWLPWYKCVRFCEIRIIMTFFYLLLCSNKIWL